MMIAMIPVMILTKSDIKNFNYKAFDTFSDEDYECIVYHLSREELLY